MSEDKRPTPTNEELDKLAQNVRDAIQEEREAQALAGLRSEQTRAEEAAKAK